MSRPIPSSVLPVLLYHGAVESDAGPAARERLFVDHRWRGAWRDDRRPLVAGIHALVTALEASAPPISRPRS